MQFIRNHTQCDQSHVGRRKQMGLPVPLTRRISDLSLDAIAIAQDVSDPYQRETLIDLLRQITSATDRLDAARLISRGLEDVGDLSAWQKRRLRSLAEHAGHLEELEHRPLPMGRDR
jgi:hypothetical protein